MPNHLLVLVGYASIAIKNILMQLQMPSCADFTTTTSRQAQRMQAWQLQYFVDMSEGWAVDLARVRALLARQGL
jgi:hypothetical protein